MSSDANLLSRLDAAPVTRTLKVGLAVVVLVWLVESFDIGLVSTIILVIQPAWHLSTTQVGLLGASATIGLVVGMILAGRMADLFGRKKVLIDANRWALTRGGDVRTGLEDNLFFERGRLAVSNAELVDRLAGLCAQYDRHPANPEETRRLLTL